ncbi:MAG: TIGR02186 family protein [Devosia marina]|uniref:TIGR02186 family protein n=1 Tax=Devosia marina TaxID=2683198 RepID=UPI0032EFC79E
MKSLLALLPFLMLATTVRAEQVVAAISHPSVEISSSFEGETLTLFGNIEGRVGGPSPYEVAVVVTGPLETVTVWEKARFFGIWSNTEASSFSSVPSFLQILSSRPLEQIAAQDRLLELYLRPEAYLVPADGGTKAARRYGGELIRLMREEGRYGLRENAVLFLSDSLYTARLDIPSHASPGPYVAQTYIFRDGEVVARKTDGFSVRKVGFERFLAQASTRSPLIYGVVSVLLALAIGWLGGVIFRR